MKWLGYWGLPENGLDTTRIVEADNIHEANEAYKKLLGVYPTRIKELNT